ncbi:UNVERIFIED_CONTAM: hypothetical protein NCL1_35555 [Trichonephila clavipes]
MLHYDNASSQTARLTIEFLKQKQIKEIEHPPYSSDLAITYDYVFFIQKKRLMWLKRCIFFS